MVHDWSMLHALEMKEFVEQPILVCALDYSGEADFYRGLAPLYDKCGIKYTAKKLSQDGELTDGEMRAVTTPANAVKTPGSKSLLIFDNSAIRTGRSALSGVAWALKNADELGVDKIYLSVGHDKMGVAHFAADIDYDFRKYMGPKEGMKKWMPKTFSTMPEERWGVLSDHVPWRIQCGRRASDLYDAIFKDNGLKYDDLKSTLSFAIRNGYKILEFLGDEHPVVFYFADESKHTLHKNHNASDYALSIHWFLRFAGAEPILHTSFVKGQDFWYNARTWRKKNWKRTRFIFVDDFYDRKHEEFAKGTQKGGRRALYIHGEPPHDGVQAF